MKELFEKNEETVREAGHKLIEVGEDLVAGRVDSVLSQIGVSQIYPAWEELIQARKDIEEAIEMREGAIAVHRVLVEVIGSILSAAFRFQLPK